MKEAMESAGRTTGLPRRSALKFVVMIGVVSLFADMTYEGRGASPAPSSAPWAPADSSWGWWPGWAS